VQRGSLHLINCKDVQDRLWPNHHHIKFPVEKDILSVNNPSSITLTTLTRRSSVIADLTQMLIDFVPQN
jgi:hypothetical protein